MRVTELKGLFAGLVVGTLLLLLFQLVGPFVEIYVIEHAVQPSVENYERVVRSNFIYFFYFLVANFVIVFCSSYSAAAWSKHKKHLYSLICGSVFLAFILFDRKLFAASSVLYGATILVSVGAMMSTLFSTREKRH